MGASETMDGFILSDIKAVKPKKGEGSKSSVKTAVKASKKAQASSWDVAWTMFGAMFTLLGRFIKLLFKFRIGLLASGFVVENGLWVIHHYGIFFK